MKYEVKLYVGGKVFTEEVQAANYRDARETATARNPRAKVIFSEVMFIVTKHRKNDIDQRTLVDNYQAAMIVAQKSFDCRVVDKVESPTGVNPMYIRRVKDFTSNATHFQRWQHGC